MEKIIVTILMGLLGNLSASAHTLDSQIQVQKPCYSKEQKAPDWAGILTQPLEEEMVATKNHRCKKAVF